MQRLSTVTAIFIVVHLNLGQFSFHLVIYDRVFFMLVYVGLAKLAMETGALFG